MEQLQTLNGIAVVLGLLLVLNIIANILGKKKRNKPQENYIPTMYNKEQIENKIYPYKPKFILTKNEYTFFIELQKIAKEMNWIICPKVGMKELFEVTDKQNYMKYFGMISQKHIDFIICKEDMKPIYAIELDDNSHNKQKVKETDEFKNRLFDLSYIKLIRIKAYTEYSKEYIIRNILKEEPKNNRVYNS